jgi:integral membrane sensor domain MASE1
MLPYARNDFLKFLSLTSIYVLMAQLTTLLFSSNDIVSFLWLSSGPVLVLAFLHGYRFFFAGFLGAILGYLFALAPSRTTNSAGLSMTRNSCRLRLLRSNLACSACSTAPG